MLVLMNQSGSNTLFDPHAWVEAAKELGFGHALILLVVLTASASFFVLICNSPKLLKTLSDHKLAVKKLDAATEREKEKRLNQVRSAIEKKTSKGSDKGKKP